MLEEEEGREGFSYKPLGAGSTPKNSCWVKIMTFGASNEFDEEGRNDRSLFVAALKSLSAIGLR